MSIGSLSPTLTGEYHLKKALINKFGLVLGFMLSISAFAEPLKVSVSLAPLHSLVAQLGHGIFEPSLIYSIEQSPHSAALRPSQLSLILNTDLLIWVDESLEHSLGRIISQRRPSGQIMQLYEENGAISYESNLTLLNNRPSLFELSTEEDAHSEHSEHDHDADRHTEVTGHAEEHGHEAHDHGLLDPHFWLSPDNALQFSRAVYQQLIVIDAKNSSQYLANLTKLESDLTELQAELKVQTQPIQSVPFIVFHDGFQYFEQAFSLTGIGSVVLIPDQPPGPKTINSLIDAAQQHHVACLFAEPQYDQKYLTFIQKNLNSAKIGVIDTLGSQLLIGETLYTELLTQLAANMISCLEYKQ
ncbi:zinc ABC transporter substrate-binding protein [Reinekea sp.]|jgi:zinc transport system substrate-binding protein|uniref:zinc ABC transporter substrate-binding protein n=1 Tax=Reinekea sp. TaxID=1970455 RepID=UPI003988A39D